MSGDVTATSGIVWSRTDRPSRMIVEYSTSESFETLRAAHRAGRARQQRLHRAHRSDGPAAGRRRVLSRALPGPRQRQGVQRTGDGTPAHRRAERRPRRSRSSSPATKRARAGASTSASAATASTRRCAASRPISSSTPGDQIYADGPIQAEVKLPDGTLWTNVVTEAKSHVAQTLDDYRGAFAYNQLDANKRRFMAEVPFLVQWDDHEVRNNWYPGQQIGAEEKRYQTRAISLLAARAKQAMFEYNPFRINSARSGAGVSRLPVRAAARRVHARRALVSRAELAEPADAARCAIRRFSAPQQAAWLKQSLKASKATWKVIASDMPISLVVPDLQSGRAEGHLRSVGQRATTARRPGASWSCGHPALHQAREHRERRVGHGRRALRAGDALRSVAREVHGVQAVLGIRRRADQRGHVRSRTNST